MRTLIGVAIATLLSISVSAQESTEEGELSTYIPASFVAGSELVYPPAAETQEIEGWVQVSFVISREGTVLEPMIEDSSGRIEFEQEALRVVRSRMYEPARLNGEPVEQAERQSMFIFSFDGDPSTVRRSFASARDDILQSIRSRDFDTAAELLADLRYDVRANLTEDASFWWLNYAYLEARGDADPREMRDSLIRALGPASMSESLSPDAVVLAYQNLYALLVQEQDFSAAIDTFERLDASQTARRSSAYEQVRANVAQHYQGLLAMIDSPNMLVAPARIGEYTYWVHELMRRSFSLGEIEGELELVDIRCDRGTSRHSAVSDANAWTVPESWGDCVVYIKGTEGSTFNFYEYPNED